MSTPRSEYKQSFSDIESYLTANFTERGSLRAQNNIRIKELLRNFFINDCDQKKIGDMNDEFRFTICEMVKKLRENLNEQQLRSVLYSQGKVRDDLYDFDYRGCLHSISSILLIRNRLVADSRKIDALLHPQALDSLYHVHLLRQGFGQDMTDDDFTKIMKLKYPPEKYVFGENNNIFHVLAKKVKGTQAIIDLAFEIHSAPRYFFSSGRFSQVAKALGRHETSELQRVAENFLLKQKFKALEHGYKKHEGLLTNLFDGPNLFKVILNVAGISTKASHRKGVLATEQKEIKTAQQPKQPRKDVMARSYKVPIDSYSDSSAASGNQYGCKRAQELMRAMEDTNGQIALHTLAKFIKTGQTESDKHFSSFFKSMSRCSGTGKNSLRGMIIDKILLNNNHTQESKRENAINAILASSISDIEKLLNDDTTILDKMLQEKQFHGYVSSHGERWI